LKTNLAISTSKVNAAEEDMLKLFSDSPQTSSQDVADIRALLGKLSEAKDHLHTNSVKLGIEASKYQDSSKTAELKDSAENATGSHIN
jgi:hypothetical protein